MASARHKTKLNKRFRCFGLKTLFFVVTVSGALLALCSKIQAERQVTVEILKLGGSVYYTSRFDRRLKTRYRGDFRAPLYTMFPGNGNLCEIRLTGLAIADHQLVHFQSLNNYGICTSITLLVVLKIEKGVNLGGRV